MWVGFIGLGQMGKPMASNMACKGVTLTVFDTQSAACASVAEHGAQVAGSVAELAAACSVVFTMLPGPPQVRSVILDELLPHLAPGSLVVDMSTIDPWTTDEVGDALRAAGHRFIDAPVGRTTTFAEKGESLFMVGADPADFDAVHPLLETMGTTIIHCGRPGTGTRVKIVNNFVAISHCQIDAEALALGAAFGLDVDTELEVLNGTLATNGFLAVGFKQKTLAGDIEPGFRIDLAHKDISIAIDAANRLALPLTMGASVREALNIARARGYGGKDFTGLLDNLVEMAGLEKPLLKGAKSEHGG
jgi:4-hydroxybutyrate dehydrogenase/sulfolactaldehyde 3-reductase